MRTLQRWRAGLLTDRRKGAPKRVANKLDEVVIAEVIETACSPEYRNDTSLQRRTNIAAPVKRHRPPEREATGPNQVWSWDITYLPLNIKGFFVYAYVFLDILSRKIVG